MSYRLCDRWRTPDLLTQRFERDDSLWVPQGKIKRKHKGTSMQREEIVAPIWYATCVELIRLDFAAAVRYLCKRYGAVLPETITFESVRDAISMAEPPEEVLKGIKLKRRKPGEPRPKEKKKQAAERQLRERKAIARRKAQHRWTYIWRWHAEGRTWCHRDAAGHRLHTVVTALAKELRRFLSFHSVDEPLMAIDAANSQMCVIAKLVSEDKRLGNRPDTLRFLEDTASGQFFERTYACMKIAKMRADLGRELTDEERATAEEPPNKRQRKRHKLDVTACWIFGNQDMMVTRDVAKALAEMYPSVHEFMWRRKRDTSALPCLCQQIEASIWIDKLAPELATRGIPATPVHDNVIVPASRVEETLEVLRRLYAEAGIRAEFRREPL